MWTSPSANASVLLPTGRTIQLADVVLETGAQQFFYGPANLTDHLSRDLKELFPGFDIARDNARLSDLAQLDRGTTPVPVGSTNPFYLWFGNVGQDIAGTSQGVRDFITGDKGGVFTLRNVLIFAAMAGGLYLVNETLKSTR